MATAFEPNSTLWDEWFNLEMGGRDKNKQEFGGRLRSEAPLNLAEAIQLTSGGDGPISTEQPFWKCKVETLSKQVPHLAGTVDRSGYGAVDLLVCAKDEIFKSSNTEFSDLYTR
ncbi:hypothetical protein B0H14DRAFT_2594735 [Mycena olivaceomarginata]|nr:hypothetical protein B0H14DRAFT_2594735 [Mycena olivaceomarginata]